MDIPEVIFDDIVKNESIKKRANDVSYYYDDLIITDGAGNVLYSASGDHTGQVITSEDGTINVAIDSDSSVSGDTLTFAVTCAQVNY